MEEITYTPTRDVEGSRVLFIHQNFGEGKESVLVTVEIIWIPAESANGQWWVRYACTVLIKRAETEGGMDFIRGRYYELDLPADFYGWYTVDDVEYQVPEKIDLC